MEEFRIEGEVGSHLVCGDQLEGKKKRVISNDEQRSEVGTQKVKNLCIAWSTKRTSKKEGVRHVNQTGR